MSSQSSVYSEKKIAAYESLFKESNFAKPQEVYLTITVAHVFGQAYILEQEGTKESDPVYSRFVCPLEEITKVYVNDKIKKPWPLFIQCDTNVKGVIHRKRIVIPCLNDPNSIAAQINEVKAIHMQKYEAAIERENQKKRAELENARIKEQLEREAKNQLPPLPAVEKLPDEPIISEMIPETKPKASKSGKTSEPAKSVKALNNELADSFKALESIDSSKSEIKPLPKKPIFDLDNLEEAFNAKPKAAPKAEKPSPAEAPAKPKAEKAEKPIIVGMDDISDAIDALPKTKKKVSEPTPEPAPVEIKSEPALEPIPEPAPDEIPPVQEIIPEEIPEAASEPEPVEEIAPEPEPAPAEIESVPKPVPDPAPAAEPVRVNPVGKAAELSEFESAVIALKAKRDSGEISADEYAAEKKKLISTLY